MRTFSPSEIPHVSEWELWYELRNGGPVTPVLERWAGLIAEAVARGVSAATADEMVRQTVLAFEHGKTAPTLNEAVLLALRALPGTAP